MQSTLYYADYRALVPGLYLCGSGAHPGGGVTGIPGCNAAREILSDITAFRPRNRDGEEGFNSRTAGHAGALPSRRCHTP
ncbi:hypothetical protein [Oryzibacter oryziterrae]|uniref:hypothetical protein n=1 Tax=Oryzibacter oryziterrae TaxID=2766474 RepID=UPI0036F4033D